jgi:hypothetical protein
MTRCLVSRLAFAIRFQSACDVGDDYPRFAKEVLLAERPNVGRQQREEEEHKFSLLFLTQQFPIHSHTVPKEGVDKETATIKQAEAKERTNAAYKKWGMA